MSNDVSAGCRLIVERLSPRLKDTLRSLIGEAEGGDVLAPVTVVGPTRYANLNLRQELGRHGFANVRFMVLPALSEALGAPALARAGRRPLTPVLEGVSVRNVLSSVDGRLAPVSEHHSTQVAVRGAFRELRKQPESTLAELEQPGTVSGEVARIFRSFREKAVADWYDAEDLAAAAAEAVEQGDTSALDELGLIVFYLPGSVSAAEARLVESLAARGRCAAVLGATGDGDADRSAKELAAKLSHTLATTEPTDWHEGQHALPADGASLHIAPNAHEELRWVIRQIIREASDRSTPFHRMAVLYRAESPYATLVPDELKLAGIPLAGPGRDSLADSGAGRTLLGLLALADGKYRRAEVMEWLTVCPVQPPAGRTPRFNPSHWDSLSRKAGVVEGLGQWRERLGRYAGDLTSRAEEGVAKGEFEAPRAEGMQREARACRDAVAFVDRLAEDLEGLNAGGTWGSFCDRAKSALDVYLSRELTESDRQSAERVYEAIEALRAADSISDATTLHSFRLAIEEALRAPLGQHGATGQGVFVSSFAAAVGMSFDVVWLVGMIEGAVPPAVGRDPLQLGLGSAGEARARERYHFLSAVSCADRRTLSYPVADGASQRQAYPSRWFLEQASALEGEPVYAGDLPSLHERPWLTVTHSSEQALSGPHEVDHADRHDYLLHRLLAWRRDGGAPASHPLAQGTGVASAIRARSSRNRLQFTEYDGNLTALVTGGEADLSIATQTVSPTRLEAWAKCPFSYFLGNVLRLSALETPEETDTISALDRGNLVHRIFERFITSAVEAGDLPAPGAAWGAEARLRLHRIAETAFGETEERGQTGKHLLWELAKQDIRDDLETFLEEDAKLRAGHNTGRVLVEAIFGIGSEAVEVEDLETRVRFRGRIDRIDLSADGTSALVIDYKSGGASSYRELEKDIIDAGRRLQLGIYSLAAGRIVPGAAEIQAAYWFTSTGAGFQFAPKARFDLAAPGVADRFRQGVNTIVEGIRAGVFPANPGPPARNGPANCTYCDFDTLCPSRRVYQWERKKSAEALSGYLSLSAAADEEAE